MSNTVSATKFAAKISNQFVPCDTLAIPYDVVLVAGASSSLDLSIPISNGIIDQVQTLFVDNSNSVGALYIQASLTNQVLKIPGLSQGYVPILAPSPPVLTFTAAGGAVAAKLQIMNTPMPIAIWPAASGANQITGVDLTSHSLVTVAATSQVLMPANSNRQYLFIKSPLTADVWINPVGGVAAIGGLDCFQILLGPYFYESAYRVTKGAITYYCVTGALNLTAFEG